MLSRYSEIPPYERLLLLIKDRMVNLIEDELEKQYEIYFNHEEMDDYFFNAKDNSIVLEILDRYVRHYIADCIGYADWQSVTTCYSRLSGYYNQVNNFTAGKIYAEKALFYFKKLIVPGIPHDDLNSQKLRLNKTLVKCCIQDLKTLMPVKPSESCDRARLHKIRYALQQILAIQADVVDQTMVASEVKTWEHHRVLYAEYSCKLASSYLNKALIDSNELTNIYDSEGLYELDEEDGVDHDLLVAQEEIIKYRFADIYNKQAQAALKNLSPDQNQNKIYKIEAEILENSRIIDENCNKILISKAINLLGVEHCFNSLCNLVSIRKNGVEELQNFINENAHYNVDVNGYDDFERVNQTIDMLLNQSLDLTLAEHIVISGNVDVFKFLFEHQDLKFSLLPTNKRQGLAYRINEFTDPALAEYLLDPSSPCHAYQPDPVLFEFYLDVMAGRLDGVREHLELEPDSILLAPEGHLLDESVSACFVLHLAYQFQQSHIIHYLENFIPEYVLSKTKFSKFEKLKCLGINLSACYKYFGWNEQRHALVNDILKKYVTLCLDKIDSCKNSQGLISTEKDFKSCLSYQLRAVEAIFFKVMLLEDLGDKDTSNPFAFYAEADSLINSIGTFLTPIKPQVLKYVDDAENRVNKIYALGARVKTKLIMSLDLKNTNCASQSNVRPDEEDNDEKVPDGIPFSLLNIASAPSSADSDITDFFALVEQMVHAVHVDQADPFAPPPLIRTNANGSHLTFGRPQRVQERTAATQHRFDSVVANFRH